MHLIIILHPSHSTVRGSLLTVLNLIGYIDTVVTLIISDLSESEIIVSQLRVNWATRRDGVSFERP